MKINEYAIDKDGKWYKWSHRWQKHLALKKEYWPQNSKFIIQKVKT